MKVDIATFFPQIIRLVYNASDPSQLTCLSCQAPTPFIHELYYNIMGCHVSGEIPSILEYKLVLI